MMTNLMQDLMENIKKDIDYQPILEEACKRVVERYNPYPSQCYLDYWYDKQHMVEKINVRIGDVVHAVVVCGKFVYSDDINKIQYTKPHVIYLGDLGSAEVNNGYGRP